MTARALRLFLVDDEPLALRRLRRVCGEISTPLEIVGEETDPRRALDSIAGANADAALLDIQMPGMSGLDLAAALPVPPWIVFVTAYDRYALRAFEVNAIDYVVKPVRAEELARALEKVARAVAMTGEQASSEAASLLERIERALRQNRGEPPGVMERFAARSGGKHVLVEVSRVTHLRADSKVTLVFTADGGDALELDTPLADLERTLGAGFARIHRAVLVNLAHVRELDARAPDGACVRLRDRAATELPVARDRVRALKERLGIR